MYACMCVRVYVCMCMYITYIMYNTHTHTRPAPCALHPEKGRAGRRIVESVARQPKLLSTASKGDASGIGSSKRRRVESDAEAVLFVGQAQDHVDPSIPCPAGSRPCAGVFGALLEQRVDDPVVDVLPPEGPDDRSRAWQNQCR